MRAVTAATAAEVTGFELKAFDNFLARATLEGLESGRQGRARRIPVAVLPTLLLARQLSEVLGIPAARAGALAKELAAGGTARYGPLTLSVDAGALREAADSRLETAIETAVRRPRGRPRRRS